MVDYGSKIKEFEAELKKTKVNKKTEGAVGLLKGKIAQLKEKQEQRIQKKTGKSEYSYSVRKSGDAVVLLLGFPSAGKSTLLNKLTQANSEVGAYDFTTLSVVPGVMKYNQAKIQILDVPGVVSGAASGRGRGKEVLAVIRSVDLVLILVDVYRPQDYPALLQEINDSHIRINQSKPEVFIRKKTKGGIQIGKTVHLDLSNETIKNVLREYKIVNADVLIRSKINLEQFIDCVEDNKKYLPAIVCVTKSDLVNKETVEKVMKEIHADLAISVEKDIGIEELKQLIFKKLDFIRVYLKEPGKEADLNEPLIVKRDCTIRDVSDKLHKDFAARFKFSRVWGTSTKFPGQKLMLNHILADKDILEIHLN